MCFDESNVKKYLKKWQKILKLQDWNIKHFMVEKEWRKSGDIKIDEDNKHAVLMINNFNPYVDNIEALVIHELLHLKLWGMDQMIEQFLYAVYGDEENDPKYDFVYGKFMNVLESTVEHLTEAFISLGAENKEVPYGRVMKQVMREIGEEEY